MTIDTTGVILEKNQSILLKAISWQMVSWFGGLFLQVHFQNKKQLFGGPCSTVIPRLVPKKGEVNRISYCSFYKVVVFNKEFKKVI